MNFQKLTPIVNKPNAWALSPLVVFLCLYLVASLLINDFYKIPITVAFMVSSIYAVATTKGLSLNDRLLQYSAGAANKNIMLMIWIFILAGAFAQSAQAMGAIDATVNLTLRLLPGNLLLAGIFLASCFISLSIGTSVGTIVALVPVAAGIAAKTDVSVVFMTAVVVGGAFFGDNLSFISDTTIAATRTQGCVMRDKFRVNSLIALPAALLVFVYYVIYGSHIEVVQDIPHVEWMKVIPYIIVLGTAVAGVNVLLVLLLGLVSTGIVGMAYGTFDVFGWFGALGKGMTGMGELIIVTLMAGGMLELIRFNGGVDYVLHRLTQHEAVCLITSMTITPVVTSVEKNDSMVVETVAEASQTPVLKSANVIPILQSEDTTNSLKLKGLDNDQVNTEIVKETIGGSAFILKASEDDANETSEETNKLENENKSNNKDANNKKSKKDGKKSKKKKAKKKSSSKSKSKYKSLGTFKITGYCSCAACCGKTTGITASGTRATAGRTIAADTSRFPFGTKLKFNGNTYTVEDRGGAIRGNRIDLYFSSHSEALAWGVRYMEVLVEK